MIVADTDVLIDALHGVEPARSRVKRAIAENELATSALSVFELCFGLRDEQDQSAVDLLLEPVVVLPVDAAVGRVAAAIGRALSRKGVRIGFADTLIAATCLVAGVPLLTRNERHFGRVPGLELERPVN